MTVYRVGPDGRAHASTEPVTCDACGIEGFRGDFPGEGGIVADAHGDLTCDACDDMQAQFLAAHARAADAWPVTAGEEGHGDGLMVSAAAMMAAAEEIAERDLDLGSFLRSAAEGADRPAPIGAIWNSVAAWIYASHAR